jgi:hypothetical protein
VIHPFLLAIFPILGLFAQNSAEVSFDELILPLSVALAGTLAVWAIASAVLRSPRKGGVFTSLAVIPFFTSGRFPQALDASLSFLSSYWVMTDIHVPPRVSYGVAASVLAPTGLFLTARIRRPESWTRVLNVFALVLVLIPSVQAAHAKGPTSLRPRRIASAWPTAAAPRTLPDIYYIVLDSYARSDVLRELFDHDNSPFLDRLEAKGFYVARRSTSNYCQTPLSLASSLNSEYLDDLVRGLGSDQTEMRDLVGRNNLIATLRPLGYSIITFSTGFDPSEHVDADDHRSPYFQLSEFQRLLLDRTPLWAFLAVAEYRDLFTQSRDRTLYLLDHLAEVADDPRPTFAFAHFLCPHPPFVFGENGEDISNRDDLFYLGGAGNKFNGKANTPEIYARSFRDQTIFITRRIEAVIDEILARSKEPPIIVLQSDHGSGLRLDTDSCERTDLHERMGILNAYHFPGRAYEGLYPEITPVNSFRVLMNTFFGASLDYLPDRNYYSRFSHPYDFQEVTETVRSFLPEPSRDE